MTRRVLVIWNNPLFSDAVRLVLEHSTIEFAGALNHHDATQDAIAARNPDVVIIEDSEIDGDLNNEIMNILRSGPKVIRLSLESNELTTYQQHKQIVGEADDLLRLVLEKDDQDE